MRTRFKYDTVRAGVISGWSSDLDDSEERLALKLRHDCEIDVYSITENKLLYRLILTMDGKVKMQRQTED